MIGDTNLSTEEGQSDIDPEKLEELRKKLVEAAEADRISERNLFQDRLNYNLAKEAFLHYATTGAELPARTDSDRARVDSFDGLSRDPWLAP